MRHNFCLSKKNILDKASVTKAFDNVEKKVSTKYFTFLISKSDLDYPRICIILAKKNIKKANQRNLCRRLVKEAFRNNKNSFENKDLIVLSKMQKQEAKKEDLWDSINHFFQTLED